MDNPLFLDLIRGTHLLCVALGMGSAIYFDLRSLHRIAQPLSQADIEELHFLHSIVTVACVGLWISGATMIWFRTSFDLASFSPKLWSKLIVVTVLTANAVTVHSLAIPELARHRGARLIDLPFRSLLPMTLCAGLSLSCWLLALALGSSSVLKTAEWDVLLPVLFGGGALCTGGVLAIAFGMRVVLRKAEPATSTS